MKIKIQNPKELVKEAFVRRWEYDIRYKGETEVGYSYEIYKVHNLKLDSVELFIHKETNEVYDPYEREFWRMVNLTYTSNKGKVVQNREKIHTLRDISALLESMWKTMGALI